MLPKFPVYVVSKGRATNGLTTRALHEMGVPHYLVVEEDEIDQYREGRCFGELLVMPHIYKAEYELCDELGFSKGTGPLPETSASTTQFGKALTAIGCWMTTLTHFTI